MIQSQIGPHVPLIIEPMSRDTFPAIALAALYLYCIKGVGLREVVCVLPVDPFAEDCFFRRIGDLEEILDSSQAELALIGVEPTFPSSKYGYIVPEKLKQKEEYFEVSHFKEKPSESQATDLIVKGALWNVGVFSFRLEYIISLLQEKGLPIQYEELYKHYSSLPKNSFDYEVVEKAKKVVVLPYNGSWKDLGTWNTLTEEMGTNQIGIGVISNDSKNTHLVNELGIPITVVGLQNVIVAASPDGILVSDKKESPKVKTMLEGIQRRPMYEERRWGWYRVLDYMKVEEGAEVLTKRICVKAKQNLSYQRHMLRSEVWTVIKGQGEFAINGFIYPVKAGDVLNIPVGAEHGIRAITELEFIEVQSGKNLIEEDIIRIYMGWDEVKQYCNKVIS